MESRNLLGLPNEVLNNILINLQPKDILANVQLGNAQLKEIAKDNALWREIVSRNYPTTFARAQYEKEISATSVNWMDIFKLQYKLRYLELEKIKKFALAYLELHEKSLKKEYKRNSLTMFSDCSTEQKYFKEFMIFKNKINSIKGANDGIALVTALIDREEAGYASITLRQTDMLYFGLADLVLNELDILYFDDASVQQRLVLLSEQLNTSESDRNFRKTFYRITYEYQTNLSFEEFRNQSMNNSLKNEEIAPECGEYASKCYK